MRIIAPVYSVVGEANASLAKIGERVTLAGEMAKKCALCSLNYFKLPMLTGNTLPTGDAPAGKIRFAATSD